MSAEKLVDALYGRVDAFFEHEDVAAVMAPEALAQAGKLERVSPADPAARSAVAWLYWARYFAGDAEVATVSAFLDRFLALRADHPDALPPYLSETLDELEAPSPDPQADIELLYSLAGAFARRFGAGENQSDIDRAVAAMRLCVARSGESSVPRAVLLCLLGSYLTQRYRLVGDTEDSAEAERLLDEALATMPEDLPFAATVLMDQVNLRMWRYNHEPTPAHVDDFVAAMWRTITELPEDEPIRRQTAELAAALVFDLADHLGPEDLDRAIAIHRLGALAAEPADEVHGYSLFQLASALSLRGNQGVATADFDEAVPLFRRAAEVTDGPLRALSHSMLGNTLLGRHERTGEPDDLRAALDAFHAAFDTEVADQDLVRQFRTNLASGLLTAYDLGAEDALAEAIQLLHTAVDADDVLVRARAQGLLGKAYGTRFRQTADRAALDEAVRWHRSAVEADWPEDYGVDHLNNLAAVLDQRAELLGTEEDLDEAIELYRVAAGARAPLPERLMAAGNLAEAYLTRYQRRGDPADAEEALRIARETARDELPSGMAPAQLATLGAMLVAAYEMSGSVADLDAAVSAIRRALDLYPDSHRRRPDVLNQLANVLVTRYELAGAAQDVVDAVDTFHEALAATAPDAFGRADGLISLCNALEHLFRLTHEVEHINEAIEAGLAGVEAASPGNAKVSGLTNLGKAYRSRHEFLGDPADLDHAIEAQRAALDSAGPDNPRRSRYLSNLGGLLAERGGDDLDEAVTLLRECAARTTAGDSRRAMHLYNLGVVLHRRHRATQAAQDRADAVEALSAATASSSSPVHPRIIAARMWAELVAETDPSGALAAYEQAVALLPVLAWHGLDRADQERRLVELVGIASDAATTAVAAGRPQRALELLEQGRSVLWSQLLDLRTDLAAVRPDLARRLEDLRTAIEQPAAADADPTPAARDRRMVLARQWDEALAEIRRLPGFADFLLPPSVAELLAVAEAGPVVVVNMSPARCDALVVTADGVTVVPLPDLATRQATEQADRLLAAVQAAHDLSGVVAHNVVLNDVLAWLWRTVAAPVLARLGAVRRVWWCPTGAMSRLPLHAAGIPGTTSSVPDRTVSSYTPTLRALALAREHGSTANPRMLVVAVPNTPGAPHLDVEPEIALLTDLALPGHTVLSDADADHAHVTAELPRHRYVHFACHGREIPLRPSSSGLVLHDATLTVLDVSTLRLAGDLAYLSACDTAASGDLPDESLHIAAALNLAGYRHVVATLWPIYDATAAQVARHFYEHLATGTSLATDHAAEALHAAVTTIRNGADTAMPAIWVPYIHVGP